MEHEPAFAGCVPKDRLDDGARRSLVRERAIWIEPDDDETAERFDGAH